MPASPRLPPDRLVSHRLRGFSDNESSLAGLERAVSRGVRYVEIDTRISRDGQILVLHDARLDRLTTSQGLVRDHSLAEQGRPRFRDGEGEPVPTLDEFLVAFARSPSTVRLLLDLKDVGDEGAHLDLLRHHGLMDRVVIVSWHPEVLLRVHVLEPSVPLSFSHVPVNRWKTAIHLGTGLAGLFDRIGLPIGQFAGSDQFLLVHDQPNPPYGPSNAVASAGQDAVHLLRSLPDGALGEALAATGGSVGAVTWQVTREWVDAAHARGLDVYAFSTDDPDEAAYYLEDQGVDLLFVDSGDLFPPAASRTP